MKADIELIEILEKFPKAKILVVGDVMLDRYWSGSASRLSPEAPVPVVALQKTSNILGGAANVAANIAGFGAKVFLCGIIGDDESAKSLCDVMKDVRINPDNLIKSTNRPTTTKTRLIVHNQQIARVDNEVNEPLDGVDEEKLISTVKDLISDVDLVVLSDYAKGLLTQNATSNIIAIARESDKSILVDPKARNFAKYSGATILTPNLSEALIASDSDSQDPGSLDENVEKIISEVDVESILVTLGESGMKLFQRDEESIYFPSTARQVFDVTGAGDTVISALATALSVKSNMRKAIKIANIAAGLAVEKVGTSIVPLSEIRKALSGDFTYDD